MTRRTVWALVLVALCAACATTPQQRELAAAQAIARVNDSAVTALDFGIIKADAGEAIQALTRTATEELRRCVAARRAGEPRDVWAAVLETTLGLLGRAEAILAGEEVSE